MNGLGATHIFTIECTDTQGEKHARIIKVLPAVFSDSESFKAELMEIAQGESDVIYGDVVLGYGDEYRNADSMRIRLIQVSYLGRGTFTYSEEEAPWLNIPIVREGY